MICRMTARMTISLSDEVAAQIRRMARDDKTDASNWLEAVAHREYLRREYAAEAEFRRRTRVDSPEANDAHARHIAGILRDAGA